MVQNSKSKKAKQAEKAPPISIDSEQSQSIGNAPSQNHTENKSEMNSFPKLGSKINGELNSLAELESSSNGASLAINSRTKKTAESSAETESTKTTVSEREEEKSAVSQNKTKGRPKKDKIKMDTPDERNSESPVASRKRRAASTARESEEVDETGSAEATAPAKKSHRKEVTAKDKEETEQESAETTEPARKSGRRVAIAKGKTKETVEQVDEIEQEPAETSEPGKKSHKRKAAEPLKAKEAKSKKQDAKKTVPDTKSKKQKVLLSIPSVESVSGKVFVMGQNDVGQLGISGEEEVKRPAMLQLPHAVTSIAAGGMHSLCLTETGEVITFGCNDEGALGRHTADDEDGANPGRVEIPERVIQISAGDSHSAALSESGQVYIWGNFRSGDGAMGLTYDGVKGVKQIRPVKILKDIQIVKISSGADHLACLSSGGIVYTCGCGQNGQLGRLTRRASPDGGRRGLAALLEPSAVPVRGHPISRTVLIEDIWTSNYSTFLKAQETGLIYAFGLNNYDQLGFSNELVAFAPRQIESFNNIHRWKEIAGGQHHTLSLDNEGLVYSMGRQDYGRLGLGENPGDRSLPTLIPSLENEKCSTISCGDDQSFAVTKEGSLYSWGFGTNCQLGHGIDEDCFVPCLVEGKFVISWKALKVSSGGQHTLVLATPKEGVKNNKK